MKYAPWGRWFTGGLPGRRSRRLRRRRWTSRRRRQAGGPRRCVAGARMTAWWAHRTCWTARAALYNLRRPTPPNSYSSGWNATRRAVLPTPLPVRRGSASSWALSRYEQSICIHRVQLFTWNRHISTVNTNKYIGTRTIARLSEHLSCRTWNSSVCRQRRLRWARGGESPPVGRIVIIVVRADGKISLESWCTYLKRVELVGLDVDVSADVGEGRHGGRATR